MRRSMGFVLAVSLALLAGCDSTKPLSPVETLATVNFVGGGGAPFVSDTLKWFVAIWPATNPDPYPNGAFLFEQLFLRPGDQGRTFVAAADTNFEKFAALLTNGSDDHVESFYGLYGYGALGEGRSESSFFTGRPTTGVDFARFTITSIEFRVDSISCDTPGKDPNHNGIWTDYYLRGSLIVFGRRD